MKRVLPAFLFLLLCGTAHAQLNSCAQSLRFARATYDQGRLHEIPAILTDCLSRTEGKDSFTKEERVEAYKLLCLTYIYLEEPEKADEAMLNLIRTDHYFEPRANSDPAEFVSLWKTFRTNPIYRIGARIGANATQPNVQSYIPANDGESTYSNGISFVGGIALELPLAKLSKKLTFAPEINFQQKVFKYTNEVSYIDGGTGQSRAFKTTGTERSSYASIPLLLQYTIIENKFNPYVSLGFCTDLLLNGKNTFLRTKEQAASLEEQTLDVTEQREKINFSAIAAAGVKFKVKGGFAIAEARYAYGLNNVNKAEDIYSNFDKVFPSGGYVDGIFKLNTLSITVGYVYNIFDPKKLKK